MRDGMIYGGCGKVLGGVKLKKKEDP